VNRLVINQSGRADSGSEHGEHVAVLDPPSHLREGVWVHKLEVLELDVLELAPRGADHCRWFSLARGDGLGGSLERPVKRGRTPATGGR
jgi:hypothetical protein